MTMERNIDRARLVADLRALGVAAGDVLAVHSSLKSLGGVEGGVEGGADCVIDALEEVAERVRHRLGEVFEIRAVGPKVFDAAPFHSLYQGIYLF